MAIGYDMTIGYGDSATMADVFARSWGRDMDLVESVKGTTGAVSINTPGAMNAIYGPFVQNLAYNMHNTLAVLGQKPYKTGRRFQLGLSLDAMTTSGRIRGAYGPAPTKGDYTQIEMPYKVSAKRQSMNLGYEEIGSKNIDDVMTWERFFALEGQTWLNNMDADVLRSCEDARFVGLGANPVGGSGVTSTEYVGLESIDRIISNYAEGAFVDTTATAVDNVPWAMATKLPSTDDAAPLLKYRNPNATGAVAESNFNCYVDHHYTSGSTHTATLREITIGTIDKMFLTCMPYWEMNKTDGKVMVTGYDTMQQVQALLQPIQRYLGQVAAQVDVNGVKTVPGRNTGFMVATYNGVPIVPDAMVQRGYGAGTLNSAGDQIVLPDTRKEGGGNIYLMDTDVIFQGMLTAPRVNISENPLITGSYTRLCDMYQQSEVQVDGMFKGLGKILHIEC